jgi:hypothetical protein
MDNVYIKLISNKVQPPPPGVLHERPIHSPEVTTMRILLIFALTLVGVVCATDNAQAQNSRQRGGVTYIYPQGTLGYYVGPQGRSDYYVVPSVSYGFTAPRNNGSLSYSSIPSIGYFNATPTHYDNHFNRSTARRNYDRFR